MSSNDNDSQYLRSKVQGSGRKKGTPNKPKKCVAEICEELGFNPFEFLANVANGNCEAIGYESSKVTIASKDGGTYSVDRISLDQRIKAASQLTPHVAPTLKAIEHSGQVDVGVYEKMAEDAMAKLLKAKSV